MESELSLSCTSVFHSDDRAEASKYKVFLTRKLNLPDASVSTLNICIGQAVTRATRAVTRCVQLRTAVWTGVTRDTMPQPDIPWASGDRCKLEIPTRAHSSSCSLDSAPSTPQAPSISPPRGIGNPPRIRTAGTPSPRAVATGG
jgi:hypothetical protein